MFLAAERASDSRTDCACSYWLGEIFARILSGSDVRDETYSFLVKVSAPEAYVEKLMERLDSGKETEKKASEKILTGRALREAVKAAAVKGTDFSEDGLRNG